jgi:hypothetical protein
MIMGLFLSDGRNVSQSTTTAFQAVVVDSARQETPHEPAIQRHIYDVENDIVSAKFRVK